MALRDWVQLALTEGIGPILTARLIALAGSPEQAVKASAAILAGIEGIGSVKAPAIHRALAKADQLVDAEIQACAELGIGLICLDDEHYPVVLRSIPDPPTVLYVKGQLEARDLNGIAVVGSRKCTLYGREQAERFAALLAGAGMTIISGGARGVDAAAHAGALAHPLGRTIAVLGCGVDQVYPPEHGALFDRIAQRGAVISEFPLKTGPLRQNFPRRNRLVSGLSRGVLVVEADIRSGALITARLANEEHGRPVFAVPGRVDNPLSAGPHALLRDGAILASTLEDILDNLGPLPDDAMQPVKSVAPRENESTLFAEPSPAPAQVVWSPTQQTVIDSLGPEPTDVETLIALTGLPAETVLGTLTVLTLRGAVRRVGGQMFTRRV